MLREITLTRLVHGAVFAAAILVAPTAFAQDSGNSRSGSDASHSYRAHRHYVASRYSHDRQHASLHARHHARHYLASYRNEGPFRDTVYRSHEHRAEVIRANYEARQRFDARREELEAADEHERPITANLNLAQLRKGRERDAEFAQWRSQYGTASSRG